MREMAIDRESFAHTIPKCLWSIEVLVPKVRISNVAIHAKQVLMHNIYIYKHMLQVTLDPRKPSNDYCVVCCFIVVWFGVVRMYNNTHDMQKPKYDRQAHKVVP